MSHQIYFGNYNLQKDIFQITFSDYKSTSANDLSVLDLARSKGSNVVQSRLTSKDIQVKGNLISGNTYSVANLQTLIEKFDQIFTFGRDEFQYFRVIPSGAYTEITPTDAITDWSVANDGANLTLKTSDYQTGNSSIGFDIDVSLNVNDNAVVVYDNSVGGVDLSSVQETGNIECSVYIPDTRYISAIQLIVGNDSSNYYKGYAEVDYQGKNFKNGNIVVSFDWASMDKILTPDNTQLGAYTQLAVIYTSDQADMSGLWVDTIQHVDENRVSNFKTYVSGEMGMEGNAYNNNFTAWTQDLLNYTGVSESTHEEVLFTNTGISAISTEIEYDIEGSVKPEIELTLTVNTATDIGSFAVTNINNNTSFDLLPSTISAGDTFRIGGLDYKSLKNSEVVDTDGQFIISEIGKNRLRLDIASTTSSTIAQTVSDTATFVQDVTSTSGESRVGYVAQSFVPATSDSITDFSFYLDSSTEIDAYGAVVNWYIMDDSAGNPNSILASGSATYFNTSTVKTITGLALPVTATNTYYLVLSSGYEQDPDLGSVGGGGGNTNDKNVFKGSSNSSSYSSGQPFYGTHNAVTPAFNSPASVGTWTGQSGDLYFSITLTPTPSWDVDITGTYKRLRRS